MTRDLTVAVAAAVIEEVVKRTAAVKLEFAGGTLYACGAPFDIVIDGDTYLGLGTLGSISGIEETSTVQTSGITLTLSGVPRDTVTTALTEVYQNRNATVWEVVMDMTTEAIVADPVVIFRGRMDTMKIDLGTTATVALTCTNRLTDWERAANSVYSDEEQQRLHAGDIGLQYAAAMETRQLPLPTVVF